MRTNWFLASALVIAVACGLAAAEPPVVAGSWVDTPKKAGGKAKKQHPWNDVYDRVTAGETVWVAVGEDYPDAVRIDNPPAGVEAGVYKCFRENDKNVYAKLVRPQAVAVSSFPAVGQFQYPAFQSGCPGGRCPVQVR